MSRIEVHYALRDPSTLEYEDAFVEAAAGSAELGVGVDFEVEAVPGKDGLSIVKYRRDMGEVAFRPDLSREADLFQQEIEERIHKLGGDIALGVAKRTRAGLPTYD